MDILKIEPSNHKPGVMLDAGNNVIQFYGASFPEDAITFFTPIVKWLNDYCSKSDDIIKSGGVLHAIFNLTYLNSSSHRTFLEIFRILKAISEKGISVKVDWHYEKNDARIQECGQELAELAVVSVNFIEYE